MVLRLLLLLLDDGRILHWIAGLLLLLVVAIVTVVLVGLGASVVLIYI